MANDPPSRAPSGPLTVSELVSFFTPSVGEEKAKETVWAVITRLRLEGKTHFDRGEALGLLDALTHEEGILGVAARFAKARILLRRF